MFHLRLSIFDSRRSPLYCSTAKLLRLECLWSIVAILTFTNSLLEVRAATAVKRIPTIGVLLPPEEPQSRSIREGILLARDDANRQSNGSLGVSIRGRVGQWGADAVEAALLVTDEGATGLIAPPDGAASHLVLQVSGRTAVPVVTLCPDSSVGRTGVPWLLRIVPSTEEEVTAVFNRVSSSHSGKDLRFTAVIPDQRAGREITRDLKKAALAHNRELDPIVEIPSLLNSEKVASRVMRDRPDAILLWLPPETAGKMAVSLRSVGYSGLLAGPGRLACSEFLNSAGSAAEGFMIPAVSGSKEAFARRQSFDAAFIERWHHQPDTMAAMSYDAAMVLCHLLGQGSFEAPPHRVPVDFCWPGVSGDVSFDLEGNRKLKLLMLRACGGQFSSMDRSE